MDSPALVALLAAPLVFLHVAVAAYLYRVTLSSDGRDLDDAPATDERADPPLERHLDAAGTTPCPTCGVPNDPSYRFCRRCVADLSGGQPSSDGARAGRLGS